VLRKSERKDKRRLRHLRLRAKIFGTSDRPRLCVFRSNKHIYAQIIDDEKGYTLCSSSTIDKGLREELKSLSKVDKAKLIGKVIAENAKNMGVKRVVFDRGGYKFHGRIKALAEAARENNLLF